MMGTSIKKPEKVGKVMDDLFVKLGIADGVKQQQAMLFWHDTVGGTIAGVSTPERIEHGRMYVRVENSSWRQELHHYKHTIIKRLNKRLKKNVVKEIIFV